MFPEHYNIPISKAVYRQELYLNFTLSTASHVLKF